jgi:UDP:flavonoid glycosyltransferase YjiC (YdhE family)
MSFFLFTPIGTLGDILPYIEIAKALKRKGCRVAIATLTIYDDEIKSQGIDFFPIAIDRFSQEDIRVKSIIKRCLHPESGVKYLINEVLMKDPRYAYDQMKGIAEAVQPSVLVSHPLSIITPLVSETLNIPHVSSVLSPMNFMSVSDPPVFPHLGVLRKLRYLGETPYHFVFSMLQKYVSVWELPIQQLRHDIGLSPVNNVLFDGKFSSHLTLGLFDQELAEKRADWPQNTKVCGYSFLVDETESVNRVQLSE